ncbi:hypothetical protein YC2023_076724 [Brassica napus]
MIGLCGYIYKKFMVVVSAYAKVTISNILLMSTFGVLSVQSCHCQVRVYIKPSSQRGCREHKNGNRGIAFLDSFFILFASYTDSLYAGARIMEKQHSIILFKQLQQFLIRFLCLLIPTKLPMQLHHVRKTTNIHTSVSTVIDRESKIDPSEASGRMHDNVKGDIEHCHTLIVNTFSDCSRKTKYFEDANKYVAISDVGSSLLD